MHVGLAGEMAAGQSPQNLSGGWNQKQKANGVGDEAGGKQQRTANQYAQAIEDFGHRKPACRHVLLRTRKRGKSLMAEQCAANNGR